MWACGTCPPKLHWGPLKSVVMQFQVCTIMQTQLTILSQAGTLGDTEKPWQDMAFILIALNLAVRCEWVFGLTDVWAHPCQAHLPTLVDVAQKLMLLANKGPNWPYAYVQMNDAMASCLFLVRDTLALWLMAYLVRIPVATWTNYRCGSYCNVGARWLALMG